MSTTTEHPAIGAALADVEEAKAHEQSLQAQVVRGDTSVSASDLAEAEAAVRLATLRVEAARRYVSEEGKRRERAAELADELTAVAAAAGDPLGDIAQLRQAAEDALEALATAAESHTSIVRGLADRVSAIDDHGGFGLYVRKGAGQPMTVRSHDAVIVATPAETVTAAALAPVLKRHGGVPDAAAVTGWQRIVEAAERGPATGPIRSAAEREQHRLAEAERRRAEHHAEVRRLREEGEQRYREQGPLT